MKKVAIVGRPNVGKSSLFNRLIGYHKSITDDSSGITRDRIYALATWLHQTFMVIDTGGIILKDEPFSHSIKTQALIAISECDLIIFVTDVRTGVVKEDLDIMAILRKSHKPLIVCPNKADDKTLQLNYSDFYALGADTIVPVSALHGIGVGDLLDEVIKKLPRETKEEKENDLITLAVVGEPNVGKSTLVNYLLKEDRMIVSPVPNTTRDAVDSYFKYNQKKFRIYDTAGINKHQFENVEKYSLLRAVSAVSESDICLLLIDSTKEIKELDKKIAGICKDHGKGLLVIFNKWDLNSKETQETYIKKFHEEFVFMDYVEPLFISALSGKNVNKVLERVLSVYTNLHRKIKPSLLTEILKNAVYQNQPPVIDGVRLRISYALMAKDVPPTFVVFGNTDKVHFTYERYLENVLREQFDFSGVPVRFVFRKKEQNEY